MNNYQASHDINVPLWHLMQPKTQLKSKSESDSTPTNRNRYIYDFGCGEKASQKETETKEEKDVCDDDDESEKRRLQFAESLMMNNADPNIQSWEIVASLIKLKYKYKVELFKIIKCFYKI